MTNTNDEELIKRLQQDKELEFDHKPKELKTSSPENEHIDLRTEKGIDADNSITFSRCALVIPGAVILLLVNLESAGFSVTGNIVGLIFLALALFAPRKFHIGFGNILYYFFMFSRNL